MKNILIILLLLTSGVSIGQSKGLTFIDGDMYWIRGMDDTVRITRNAPSVSGQSGKLLSNNGTDLTWIQAGAGTGDMIGANNLSDVANAATARTNLGVNTQAEILLAAYPVGSIYISVSSTNPSSLFGGTWVAFGAGRTLVGIDAGQTEFDVVEETGGAKTHTLTEAEIPSHTHTQNAPTSASGGARRYAVDTNASGSVDDGQTSATGGGGAHNNLQPYIVVYMFKRIS